MKTRSIIVWASTIFLLYFLLEVIRDADALNFLHGIAFISIIFLCAAFLFHDIDLRDARRKIKELEQIMESTGDDMGQLNTICWPEL